MPDIQEQQDDPAYSGLIEAFLQSATVANRQQVTVFGAATGETNGMPMAGDCDTTGGEGGIVDSRHDHPAFSFVPIRYEHKLSCVNCGHISTWVLVTEDAVRSL